MIILLCTVLQLTKEMAVERAFEGNLEFQSRQVELAKAKLGIDEAYSAIYPKVDLTFSYTYLSPIPVVKFQVDPTQPEMEIPMGRARNYALGASISQPLFTWGNLYRAIHISKLNYQMEELNLVRQKQILNRDVKNGFDNCLLAKDYLALLTQTKLRLARYYDIIEKRYKAGLVPRYDLIRTEAELAQNESQIIEAENNIKLAKDALKMLLNIDDEIDPIGELEVIPFEIELDSAIAIALAHRSEAENLALAKRMAETGLKMSAISYLPTVFGAVQYSHDKPYQLEEEWGGSWVFNVGVNWPIFSGFKTKTEVGKARLEIKKVDLSNDMLKSAIELEVKSAFYRLKKAKAMINAQLKVISQAEETRKMIEKRYSHGLATALELLDGELVYSQARIGHLQALIDYDQAFNDLILAIGKEE